MTYLPGIVPPPANVPRTSPNDPFLVATDSGELTTAYANAGVVSDDPVTASKRRLANDVPWAASPQPAPLRKLTHFRAPGMGDAMWSGACVYDIAGVSPSFSYYDDPDVYAKDDGLTTGYEGGIVTMSELQQPAEGTTTRRPRVAAHQDTAPAARFFQGYWNPHWSGLLAGFVKVTPRPLHMNFNPGQQGTKELHRATEYKPAPPMGSIVGFFGEGKAL